MSDKTVQATLVIRLDVTCPECGFDFDLVNDTNLNEEGWLLHQTIADDRWEIPSEHRLQCVTHCPKCSSEFEVSGVEW